MRNALCLFSGTVAAVGIVAGGLTIAKAATGFTSSEEARAHCPSDTVVWGDTRSRVCHYPGVSFHGHSYLGNTSAGAYMCEPDARAHGNRPAMDERSP